MADTSTKSTKAFFLVVLFGIVDVMISIIENVVSPNSIIHFD